MRIPKQLPQFDRPGLLIVTGRQEAKFFIAHDGQIQEIDKFKIDKPKYSDREGLFANRSGHGALLERGAGYENQDEKVEQDFIRSLRHTLKSLAEDQDIDQVFIFSPPEALSEVIGCVPLALFGKITFSLDGNLMRAHPTELLRRIKQADDLDKALERRPAIKEEALKILKRHERVKV